VRALAQAQAGRSGRFTASEANVGGAQWWDARNAYHKRSWRLPAACFLLPETSRTEDCEKSDVGAANHDS
jgi:hypothetical protein